MSGHLLIAAEFWPLLDAACADELTDDQTAELQTHLESNPAARRAYIANIQLRTNIRQWWKGERARASGLCRIEAEIEYPTAAAGVLSLDENPSVGETFEQPPASFPSLSRFPQLSTTHYPLSANFVGGPVFSYMVATVVLCMMMLSAWAYKITRVEEMVEGKGKPSIRLLNDPRFEFVGHVTGVNDCVWAKDSLATMVGASVPVRRKYELISGLMEITYNSGARVILEGPCEYTVDSDASGYLGLGKLTAHVEKKKPQVVHPSSLRPHPSALFSITTPTAVVTDLGTEFGVEVSEEGSTVSHVFRGSVRVQAIGDGGGEEVVLRSNESARVEKGKTAGDTRILTGNAAGIPPKFVRRTREPLKYLDLLDIVAGGNGAGSLRERGIDPTTGKQDTWPLSTTRKGGKEYKQVEWNIFVDGVFTPYIKSRIQNPDVQLDSAGHIFKGFADHKLMEGQRISNNLSGKTVGGIWARAADCDSKSRTINASNWMHNIRDDRQYMPDGRGLLGLHANAGITFDLKAIRSEHEGTRPARFRAVAGLADGPRKFEDAVGAADIWIFVDGQLVWKHMYLRNQDGTVDVEVELGPEARFLSIVTTNCQFGFAYDWVVLGDPVLEMKSTESDKDDEQ